MADTAGDRLHPRADRRGFFVARARIAAGRAAADYERKHEGDGASRTHGDSAKNRFRCPHGKRIITQLDVATR